VDVILLQDVEKVGLKGEVVNVARGYARNYLLPRRLAEPATPGRIGELQRHQELRARHEAQTVEQAQETAQALEQTELRFDMKAGPTGSLFGSVTATDLAEPVGDRLRVFEGLRLVLGPPILDLAHLRDPCRSRLVGKTTREEEVARVAARHADDLPAETDLVDVLTEDDFHYLSAT